MWFFSARVKKGGLIELRDQIASVVDAMRAAKVAKSADHALGELGQQLSATTDFLQAFDQSGAESQLSQVVLEVTRQVAASAHYLQSRIMDTPPETLLQSMLNSLQSLLNYLEKVVERDVGQRMAKVVEHVQALKADTLAHLALRDICRLMDFEALAKRLYVHPYDASVVAKSVAGFITAAEKMQMNLREFSEWIGKADAASPTGKSKQAVLLVCAANSKGKEFEHVLLPFLEKDEFPSARANSKEEENLFYVAATRAKSCLTLISPKDEARRSPYIERMKITGNRARADAAVSRNANQLSAPLRIEFKANGDDWARAKALGALWDFPRKVFYLKDGQDSAPFAEWLDGRDS
jgi:DNA helicase-2/ATP-dependent DNA helicase PcrA